MDKGKQKSLGIYLLGSVGILISVTSFGILVYMNRTYPELFTIRRNLLGFSYPLLLFIASCGLFFYKAWARMLFISIFSVRIVESLIKTINYIMKDLPQMKPIHLLEQTVNIMIFSLFLYFLFKKSTRDKFKTCRKGDRKGDGSI